MLTFVEKIIFILFVIISFTLTYKTFKRMFKIISRGSTPISWSDVLKNFPKGLQVLFSQQTLFTTRPVVGFVHALIAWGFIIYMLVNLPDVIAGFVQGFTLFPNSTIGFIYRLFVDVFSVLVISGVTYFLIRRFVFNEEKLIINEPVYLSSKAKVGVRADSLLVGLFIILHIGGRFVGSSFVIAQTQPDSAQPFATMLASLWEGLSANQLMLGEHISWWFSLGLILAFLPYFPLSKHVHLFMAPLNHMLPDERPNKGTITPIDFEDESVEQFGVANLEHLPQKSLLDAYACIMCNRCQDECPAYQTGKELSPSAIEINKRYYLNANKDAFAKGTEIPLNSLLLTDNALWSCTSCNYCVTVCPVGNNPMMDILEMRQNSVMMESNFPDELTSTFRNIEANYNPWGFNQQDRAKWTEGLNIKTLAEDSGGEVLFWVGCAGSYDAKAQKTSQAFAKIMQKAGVDFRILGTEEKCNGDTARRLGNEYLAQTLMKENIEKIDSYGVKKIVTTCPHCFNSIKNEYPQFGGKYEVLHHTQFIDNLVKENKISLKNGDTVQKITYHDSCYLGRYNSIYDQPRNLLNGIGTIEIAEPKRNKKNGFCCGAGGGHIFLEENADTRINEERTKELLETKAEVVAAACPFCITMINDGLKAKEKNEAIVVKDIAEIILEHVK